MLHLSVMLTGYSLLSFLSLKRFKVNVYFMPHLVYEDKNVTEYMRISLSFYKKYLDLHYKILHVFES